MDIERQLRAVLDEVEADGAVCVLDINTGLTVELDADEPAVLASVFKLPVLVELHRQAAAGQIDTTRRLRIPAEGRSPGDTGLSAMRDEAELSVRDTAMLMMSVSDNAATDVVMDLVGIDGIDKTMRDLGLPSITVTQSCRTILDQLSRDIGLDAPGEAGPALATPDPEERAAVLQRARRSSVLDPARTNAGTARDLARLLAMIWLDQAAPAEACAEIRSILGVQVWPHRLRSGFPDSVATAGKTGTLPFLRNEAGVVEYPDVGRYAVAVLLRPASGGLILPDVDRAIGRLARLAVEHLRVVQAA